MERRNFLKLAFGVAAGAAAFTAAAQAAPLAPQVLGNGGMPSANPDAHPAVTSSEEAAQLKPEQVHWHGHGHGHWHRRHWGWRHRHWGWHRRWHHHRHWRRW
ncbi:twin-arginine translocation signal domain-containing protein [Bradyrhizobium sp. WYCCWR 13022]|uniref:twin-arginine translocation signal domain-containing protein n=1 Tax=unclassified Bradyrhizobium TaxID=2631580 RepID=UPI00263B6CA8|nr:twin-arginine translocation signal domain-containing protein [Bradyrhizobium sp. WYCCWR 13022]MDN4988804.1 twin-arginine translocation signal domain-containing protein [Bradyrhizobium sp. WYCCWR 13022]